MTAHAGPGAGCARHRRRLDRRHRRGRAGGRRGGASREREPRQGQCPQGGVRDPVRARLHGRRHGRRRRPARAGRDSPPAGRRARGRPGAGHARSPVRRDEPGAPHRQSPVVASHLVGGRAPHLGRADRLPPLHAGADRPHGLSRVALRSRECGGRARRATRSAGDDHARCDWPRRTAGRRATSGRWSTACGSPPRCCGRASRDGDERGRHPRDRRLARHRQPRSCGCSWPKAGTSCSPTARTWPRPGSWKRPAADGPAPWRWIWPTATRPTRSCGTSRRRSDRSTAWSATPA